MNFKLKQARPRYRLRIFLFLVAALFAIVVLDAASQAIRTFERLNIVDRSRDHWQRPADIIAPLNLREGSTVADIGCGAGYFALKLAPLVGKKGSVLAIDILKEPLAFLWVRARLRNLPQLHVTQSAADDPGLPMQKVDAVLIANTYREFTDSEAMAQHVFDALRPGGRLVVVDRGPVPGAEGAGAEEAREHHERSPQAVEQELLAYGFELVSRQDGFILSSPLERSDDRPELHPWWLLVLRRPY
jgi:predicted methyltransferase